MIEDCRESINFFIYHIISIYIIYFFKYACFCYFDVPTTILIRIILFLYT